MYYECYFSTLVQKVRNGNAMGHIQNKAKNSTDRGHEFVFEF